MRPIAIVSLLLLLPPAANAQQGFWEQHYAKRVAEFEAENKTLPKGKKHVVLLGSSSMEGWKNTKRVERFLPTIKDRVLNRGISADRIGRGKRGILHRLDVSVFDSNPSHVFLLNGRNDLGKAKAPPVKDIAKTYRKVVEAIQKRDPSIVVCIVTCAPVNKSYAVMKTHLTELNRRLKAIAKDLGCPVIDLHGLLVGYDGLMPLPLTLDGLHFNDKGYAVLGEQIEAVVKKTSSKKAKRKNPRRSYSFTE